MKSLQKLGKALSKAEQKSINGGARFCIGTGTGGVTSPGYSTACIGYSGDCTINGNLAECTGGGEFWYY